MDLLVSLNRACKEVGVCDSDTALIAPGVKHAAELYKDGSNRRVRVACFEDGMVTSCVIEVGEDGKTKAEKVCCYTAADGGMELAMAWEAHLTSPEVGYKARPVEVEGQELSLKVIEESLKEGISACGDVPC